MKRFCVLILALSAFFLTSPRIYAHDNDLHPYHHHYYHYRGGYIFCPICRLYHHPDHPHFRYVVVEPTIVEHQTTVEHQTVTETQEVVE